MNSIPESNRPSLRLTCTSCGSTYRLILIAGVIQCHDCRVPPVTVAPSSVLAQYEVIPLNVPDNGGWFGYRREQ